MSLRIDCRMFWLVGIGCALGCGASVPPAGQTEVLPPSPPKTHNYLLPVEPAGAKGVATVRKEAKDGDKVVMLGRIGGDVEPWVKDRAVFLLVDPALVPCNEKGGDACPTPWDYCCDLDVLPANKATVKFLDDEGKTVPVDSRLLLGVKELQTVVVSGTAKRDLDGNLTVHAKGLHVRTTAPASEPKKP